MVHQVSLDSLVPQDFLVQQETQDRQVLLEHLVPRGRKVLQVIQVHLEHLEQLVGLEQRDLRVS